MTDVNQPTPSLRVLVTGATGYIGGRLVPRVIKRFALEEEVSDCVVARVARNGDVTGLNSRAEGGLDIAKSGRDGLRPQARDFHGEVGLGLVGGEIVLFDEIAREFCELVPL